MRFDVDSVIDPFVASCARSSGNGDNGSVAMRFRVLQPDGQIYVDVASMEAGDE